MLRDAEFTRLKSAGKHLFGKIFAVEKSGAVLKVKIRIYLRDRMSACGCRAICDIISI